MASEMAVDIVIAPQHPQILGHLAAVAPQGNSEASQRKYKDGWWTAVGRQSLSRRPPGPIPALLRQSDLWARAVAAAAVADRPPSRSAALKARVRGILKPPCIVAKTSPSETFPRVEEARARETVSKGPVKFVGSLKTVYGGCFGIVDGSGKELRKKKEDKRRRGMELVECCAVPNGRTLWSSSERVHTRGEGKKGSVGSVLTGGEGTRSFKVGQVSNRIHVARCKNAMLPMVQDSKRGALRFALTESAAKWH